MQPTQPKKKVTLLSFACIGHCLELYDHTLYGVMLPFLAWHFFPTRNPLTSLFFAFLSFTLAFIISPLGSLFWGWYSDKFGRLTMLRSTMLIMAFPSLGIAILPSYAHIGWLAPLFLMVFRMMQSISASGEIIGARIFIMENLSEQENGFASGIITAVGALGVLLAMGMGYACTLYENIEGIWRLPFFLGSALFIVGQLIRKRLSDVFLSLPSPSLHPAPRLTNTLSILKSHPAHSLIVLTLGAMLGIMSYTMHTFINPYLIQHDIASPLVYQYSIIGLVCTMLFAMLAGYYVDQYKHISLYQRLVRIMVFYSLMATPLFIIIQQGDGWTLLAYMAYASLLGAYVCVSGIVMYYVFSPQMRGQGMLFNYALGCATFGSLTPLTLHALGNLHPYLPGIALSLTGFLSLFVVHRCIQQLQVSRTPTTEMIFQSLCHR